MPEYSTSGTRRRVLSAAQCSDILSVARNSGIEAVVADVRSLPFAEASFGVVFSGSTLDHFESAADIQRSLGELYRVLRPGGTLILTLDNPANPLIEGRSS